MSEQKITLTLAELDALVTKRVAEALASSGAPTPTEPTAQTCSAVAKTTGKSCKRKPIPGTDRCTLHPHGEKSADTPKPKPKPKREYTSKRVYMFSTREKPQTVNLTKGGVPEFVKAVESGQGFDLLGGLGKRPQKALYESGYEVQWLGDHEFNVLKDGKYKGRLINGKKDADGKKIRAFAPDIAAGTPK